MIALNICTFHRREYVEKNVRKLLASKFFSAKDSGYYGHLHIFVTDNGRELSQEDSEFVHIRHNRNVGGSGGFQKGLEEIRESEIPFSHVIFMDDDVEFEIESFYILYDFLLTIQESYADYPIAGRMFCLDKPDMQYTAAEIWNRGKIGHVEYMKQISADNYTPGKVILDSGADYGGWWFCCYPMSFVKDNDVMPFFIHCDDVEYGLRCGKPPVIIEGVQVWHETFEKRQTPLILYYDTRNPLFVNEVHNLSPGPDAVLAEWKQKISNYHVKQDWLSEYYLILAMSDFLKGLKWLKRIDPERHYNHLKRVRSCKVKNAIAWRVVQYRFKKKYNI